MVLSLDSLTSNKLILNTDLPQGCVLFPILFSVYTDNICDSEAMTFKYADNMALVAHLMDSTALTHYQQTVNDLVQIFNQNSLELYVTKRKELCCVGEMFNFLFYTPHYPGSIHWAGASV